MWRARALHLHGEMKEQEEKHEQEMAEVGARTKRKLEEMRGEHEAEVVAKQLMFC